MMPELKVIDRQRGTALVIVLLTVAIISVITIGLSEKVQRNIQLTENDQILQQIRWYQMGAEQLLLNRLNSDIHTSFSIDGRFNKAFTVKDGVISIRLRDLRTCFNINSIADHVVERGGLGLNSAPVIQLKRLALLKGLSNSELTFLIERLYDWLDLNTIPSGGAGAEDLYYMGKRTAYRTGNGPIADFSELSLMEIPLEIQDALKEDVCVLPLGAGQLININSIDNPQLIVIALPDGSSQLAATIINSRPAEGYQDLNEVSALVPGEQKTISDRRSSFILATDFIRAEITVQLYGMQRTLISDIQIADGSSFVYRRVVKDRQ